MESVLSERSQELLKVAGWFPNRRVETHDFEQVLAQLGCPFFPVVENFLSEFGGIEFNYSPAVRSEPDFLCFTTEMFQKIRSFDIRDDVRHVGRPLCLICVVENPRRVVLMNPPTVLMMDSEGNVYQCTDVELPELIAHSGEEAINIAAATENYPLR